MIYLRNVLEIIWYFMKDSILRVRIEFMHT